MSRRYFLQRDRTARRGGSWRADAGWGMTGVFMLLAATLAMAQPAPRLDRINPEWIKKGSTVEVILTGTNLSAITRFIFDGEPGLSATNIPAAPPAAPAITLQTLSGSGISTVPPGPPRDESRLRITLTAAADASMGSHELRVVTPTGVSNPVKIDIGQWPELTEKEPNNTTEQAQMVSLPASMSGVISGPTEVDMFRFKARKGEEIIVDVDAARAGSVLDSSLVILDAQGKELMRNEDQEGFDSLIEFPVPADGEYLIQLRDYRYQGSGAHKYRVHMGALPYLSSIFPFGGQRGSRVEVALRGRNLEGTSKMTLDIAPGTATGRQEIRATTPGGFSNPIGFDVQSWGESTETETNNTLDKANSVMVPAVVNGNIGSAEDIDYFKFKSDKDQKLICEVVASRFGSLLDPLLVLQDAKGGVLQQNDDVSGADARIELDAKKDTEYVLAVRDLTDGGGDGYFYRLAIRPPSTPPGPSFSAVYLPDSIRLHRQGVAVVRCEVSRVAGFKGPVRLEFENLPVGVFSEPLILTETPASGLLALTAGRDAVLGSTPLRLVASATFDGKPVQNVAQPIQGSNAVRAGYLTVLEPSPFALETATLTAAAEQDDPMVVDVLAQRRNGFEGEIKLAAEGFSAGREPLNKSFDSPAVALKAKETMGKLTLKVKTDAEVGTRTIVVKATAIVDGHPVTEYTRPFPLTVAQIPFLLSSTLARVSVTVLPPGSESAAGESATTIKVDRRAGFDGELALSLEGILAGIRTELTNIPAKGGETILKLFATDKAVAGTNTFRVIGTGVLNDRTFKRKTDQVTLVVSVPETVEPAKPPVAAAAAVVPPNPNTK